jgi:hypothetical protein
MIDTHSLYRRFRDAEFTHEQAEALTYLFFDSQKARVEGRQFDTEKWARALQQTAISKQAAETLTQVVAELLAPLLSCRLAPGHDL